MSEGLAARAAAQAVLSDVLRKRRPLSLHPVLAWKARIAQIKTVPKGAFIGYGDPVFGGEQTASATRSGIRRNLVVRTVNRNSDAAPQSRIADLAALPDTAQ